MDIQSIIIRLVTLAVFYFISDIFLVPAIKNLFDKNPKKAAHIFWWINLGLLFLACLAFFIQRYVNEDIARFFLYFFGVFMAFLFSKLIFGVLLFAEFIIRLIVSIFKNKGIRPNKPGEKYLVSRRKFISQTSFLIGAIPFSGFIYGMIKGKYDFTVHKETLFFDDLPAAFDGITITQISDLHMGSWDAFAKHKLEYLVELIQSLQSDILFFTGDIVNSKADEMDGWYDVFNNLAAPLGKYSILGNHDYGDYVKWETDAEEEDNLNRVKNIHPQLGFQLLLNQNTVIEKGEDKLFIIGVENWGKGDFPKIGDIKKASEGIQKDAFKILLSHDPSHWNAKVLEEEFPPQLTLSGHTHGFQMGIEIPAFRFSPSQWIYEQWAGIYQKGKNYLYVNRGLGTVGYPGRIGIWPEVTQITLKRK
ncbi:MAG: metallophosphoesterase [Fimbriimonadaceae bacterium]|nr:metallophosphoesterase [Chitinophagales bacterium]